MRGGRIFDLRETPMSSTKWASWGLVLCCILCGASLLASVTGNSSTGSRFAALTAEISARQSENAELKAQIWEVRNELKTITTKLEGELAHTNSPQANEELPFHALADANAIINALGNAPSAEQLAEAIANLDTWLFKPEEEKAAPRLKTEFV